MAPTSANPAANTTANLAWAAMASRRMGRGSPTRIATRSSGSSMSVSALAQGRPATTGRLGLTKYTVAPRSSAQTVIFWVSAVLGRALESEAPDHGHPLRAEEGLQVDGAEGGRSARDVRPVARRRGPSCHVPPSCRAVLHRRPAASVPSGSGAARRPAEGPRGHSPYMTPVSVSIPSGARSSPVESDFGRIVGPLPPPLRYVTDVSVFSSDRGPHGHFGRENRHRHRVGPRHRPGRGARAGGAGRQGGGQRPRGHVPRARVRTSVRPTRRSRRSRRGAARPSPTTTTSPTSAGRRT